MSFVTYDCDDDAGRLVVVECDGGGGVGFWVSCEPFAGRIVVDFFVASAGGEDGAHRAALDVRGDGGVGVGVVGVVDHGVFSFLNVSRRLSYSASVWGVFTIARVLVV